MATWGGHNAVEEQFGSNEVSRLGAYIARIGNAITTDSPSDAVWDNLLWAVGTNNVEVGGTFSWGNGRDWDEKDGVSPGCGGGSLSQVVDLNGIGLHPEGTAFAKGGVFGRFGGGGPIWGTLGGKVCMEPARPTRVAACACLHGGSEDRRHR